MSISNEKISTKRVILTGIIGNTMEWYDFALYGYFASVIGDNFFPSADPTSSLLAAFAAFAAGFVVRPFGGLFFGRIGDIFGRERALQLSIIFMACPTILMAIAPTYSQIGIFASIVIVILRLLQGLSVGGEYTSSIIFLCEQAPKHRRGLYAIWGLWGSVLGMLLGSSIGALITQLVLPENLSIWGWRIPFALGSIVAVTGLLLRKGLKLKVNNIMINNPIKVTLTSHLGDVIKVMLLNVASSVVFYLAFVYDVNYIEVYDGINKRNTLSLNTEIMIILLLLYPISAWISDRIGRRPMFLLGTGWLLFGSVPIFRLIHSTNTSEIFRGEIALAIAVALLAGAKNAANVELMPAEVRCTGLALAFNAAEGWFGGTTPLLAVWLITITGNVMIPSILSILAALITLITSVVFTKESAFSEL